MNVTKDFERLRKSLSPETLVGSPSETVSEPKRRE
jgi:hypothetical protein